MLKNRTFFFVVTTVCILHIAVAIFMSKSVKDLPAPKKMIVQHRIATPEPIKKTQTTSIQPSRKTQSSVPKKQPKKATPALKKPTPKPIANELSQLQEKVSKLIQKTEKVAISSPKLKPTPTLTEDLPSDLLITFLQNELHLPELGEVKIELIMSAQGKVISVKVLASESKKNEQYLEKHLPELSFPKLTLSRNETFLFTFCNET